ncbi:MAG: hypothetical protein Q8R73_09225 [Bradyrhizobium sp.]|nr:hypothetical protein [Bradyrhizobium sp.]
MDDLKAVGLPHLNGDGIRRSESSLAVENELLQQSILSCIACQKNKSSWLRNGERPARRIAEGPLHGAHLANVGNAGLDLFVFGCTSGGSLFGLEYDRNVANWAKRRSASRSAPSR